MSLLVTSMEEVTSYGATCPANTARKMMTSNITNPTTAMRLRLKVFQKWDTET